MKVIIIVFLIVVILLSCVILYCRSQAVTEKQFASEGVIQFSDFVKNSEEMQSFKRLKIVTWNMGYASGMTNNQGLVLTEDEHKANLKEMVLILKELNPDIIFLQEVDFLATRSHNINQFEFLAKELNVPYGAYAVLWNKAYVPFPYWPVSKQFGKVLSGQAVLSRFPISEHRITKFEKPPNAFWYNWFYLDRIMQRLQLRWNENNLAIWNVHHEAFHVATRLQQAQRLGEDILKNAEAFKIVAGDFNDPTQVEEFKLKGQDVTDTLQHFKNMAPLNADSASFSDAALTFPSDKPIDKLDHVLISLNFKFKDRKVICSGASDHCLVYVEIEKQ